MLERRYRPDGPLDVALTLSPLRRSPLCMRVEGRHVVRATRTPDGTATLHLVTDAAVGEVRARAWGDGAAWALEHLPALLGAGDDPSSFRPRHPLLRDLHRRRPGLRICRSEAVVELLVPTVIEQKVTGREAHASYAAVLRRFGTPAPGPVRLLVPPSPEVLAATPYFAFHPFGVERKRADTVRTVAMRAARLEEVTAMALDDAYRRLRAVPGVGIWTAASVAAGALGDPDAVPVGDYHFPGIVGWALARDRHADDARMLELLEPFRGHRGRVIRLLVSGGPHPERRGPRLPVRSYQRL